MIEVNWSGQYPNKCRGEWTLKIDGEDVSDKIPKKLRNQPMGTYGTYKKCVYSGNKVSSKWYSDGLEVEEWIEQNNYWLKNIVNNYALKMNIYAKFQEKDFRQGQCGGCI